VPYIYILTWPAIETAVIEGTRLKSKVGQQRTHFQKIAVVWLQHCHCK